MFKGVQEKMVHEEARPGNVRDFVFPFFHRRSFVESARLNPRLKIKLRDSRMVMYANTLGTPDALPAARTCLRRI